MNIPPVSMNRIYQCEYLIHRNIPIGVYSPYMGKHQVGSGIPKYSLVDIPNKCSKGGGGIK